jgi:hypothetical protein
MAVQKESALWKPCQRLPVPRISAWSAAPSPGAVSRLPKASAKKRARALRRPANRAILLSSRWSPAGSKREEQTLRNSSGGLGAMLVLALAAWNSGCRGVVDDGGGVLRDGGGVVVRDGGDVVRDSGRGISDDGGGGGGGIIDAGGGGGGVDRDGGVVRDGGSGVLDGGGGGDAGPSPWVDLVTRIRIDAEAEIAEEQKVAATLEIRRFDDDSLVADGIHVGIKIRGHLSLQWPKKNYAVEVWDALGKDGEYNFLDMGAGEDWALHGPFVDRSLLHNAVINHLSNQIGRYAPETRLATLAIRAPKQSVYKELGVYILMEQIRFSKHRLQVDKTSPDGSKKAFLLKIDWTDGDEPYRTTKQNTPIFFVYPPDKSRTTADENTALAVLNNFEASLSDPKKALNYIDKNAAADYFILTELARNPDGYRKSYYFHIPADGLITFGPLWDFDLAFGISEWDNATQVEGWQYEHQEARYFRQLLQVDTFRLLIKARWQQLRQTELSDKSFENVVQTFVKRLGPDAIAANNGLWPVSGPRMTGLSPEVAGLTKYDQVVDHLIRYGKSRMQWMDTQIQSW